MGERGGGKKWERERKKTYIPRQKRLPLYNCRLCNLSPRKHTPRNSISSLLRYIRPQIALHNIVQSNADSLRKDSRSSLPPHYKQTTAPTPLPLSPPSPPTSPPPPRPRKTPRNTSGTHTRSSVPSPPRYPCSPPHPHWAEILLSRDRKR